MLVVRCVTMHNGWLAMPTIDSTTKAEAAMTTVVTKKTAPMTTCLFQDARRRKAFFWGTHLRLVAAGSSGGGRLCTSRNW